MQISMLAQDEQPRTALKLPNQSLIHSTVKTRLRFSTSKHVSSGEERRAHNPEDPGSKPGHAMLFVFRSLYALLPLSPF